MAGTNEADIQERILDAAEQCFLEEGLTARLHHVIAMRAGVSRPTVYKHVGDQDAIAEALLYREVGRFLAAAQSVLARRGPLRERFTDTIVFAVSYAREHALLQRMLREQPQVFLPWLTTRAAPVLDRAVAFMAPYVNTGGRPEGSPKVKPEVVVEWGARLVVSLITTPSVTANLAGPRQLRRYVSALLDIGLDRREPDGGEDRDLPA